MLPHRRSESFWVANAIGKTRIIGLVTVASLIMPWGNAIASPNLPLAQAVPIDDQVRAIVEHLVGVMDTSAQATAKPDAPSVRMTTCQVRVEASDPIFLYQEQALTQRLERPYRQRFLRIAPSEEGQSVESRAYKPINPETWIGLCDRPQEQRLVRLGDLSDAECSVFLVPVNNIYIGNTQVGGCSTNIRGAVRITNTIFLHAAGMDTWDRGFDAEGKQVWGAESQAYQFRWVTRSRR
jgi:CpeT/CpcT family (DUF1001)